MSSNHLARLWQIIFDSLVRNDAPDFQTIQLGSSLVKGDQHTSGARKNDDECLGKTGVGLLSSHQDLTTLPRRAVKPILFTDGI